MITELPIEAYEGERHYTNGVVYSNIPFLPLSLQGTNPRVPLYSATYVARGIKFVHEACQIEGADITAWQDMAARLDPSHPLWGNRQVVATPLHEPGKGADRIHPIRGFHNISLHAEPVPLGTWHSDESQKILGGMIRLWGFHHAQSVFPVVMLGGLEENQANEFIEKLLQEMMDVDKYRAYLICHMWLARKI